MTTMERQRLDGFHAALVSAERAPEISEADDVYGWLVGSWELDVLVYGVDVSERKIKGEAHFARTLEGRAVQDVWIMPRRVDRPSAVPDFAGNMYGTTLRIWDPAIQAWRVTWHNPVTGQRNELIGRWDGEDIAQVGTHANGAPIRWTFTEITPDSFRWTGEALQPDGKTWKVEGQFFAHRTG